LASSVGLDSRLVDSFFDAANKAIHERAFPRFRIVGNKKIAHKHKSVLVDKQFNREITFAIAKVFRNVLNGVTGKRKFVGLRIIELQKMFDVHVGSLRTKEVVTCYRR